MQKESEFRSNSSTKNRPGISLDCRRNAAWAAFPRPGSLCWPRALARGFSWSVHLVVSFWKLYPDSLFWDFGITWEASYPKSKSPISFNNKFVILLWLLSSSCKCVGLNRSLSFPLLCICYFGPCVFAILAIDICNFYIGLEYGLLGFFLGFISLF